MKNSGLFIIVAMVVSLIACDDENNFLKSEVSQLVVEGWIEDGAKPIVIITRAVDFSSPGKPIDEFVQRWCRVTVSDGTDSEILAMEINENYVPSVIYTSNRLRGKVGHTYTLKVETDTDTVTAVTTIPPVAKIDSLRIVGTENSSMCNVRLYANVQPTISQYYKIFTQVNGETRYYSSFLGLFSIDEYDNASGWNVARGIHQTFDGHYTPNYVLGDTVNVKLCTMDFDAYRFWKSYETAVSLQSNFFFTSTDECQGNIVGGKGYWAGYGTSFARCIIR